MVLFTAALRSAPALNFTMTEPGRYAPEAANPFDGVGGQRDPWRALGVAHDVLVAQAPVNRGEAPVRHERPGRCSGLRFLSGSWPEAKSHQSGDAASGGDSRTSGGHAVSRSRVRGRPNSRDQRRAGGSIMCHGRSRRHEHVGSRHPVGARHRQPDAPGQRRGEVGRCRRGLVAAGFHAGAEEDEGHMLVVRPMGSVGGGVRTDDVIGLGTITNCPLRPLT